MSEKKLPRHLIPLLFASIRNEEARQYLKFKYRIESKKFKLNPNFYLYNYFRNKAGYSSYGVSYDQVEAHKNKNEYSRRYIDWLERNGDYHGLEVYCNVCGYRLSRFKVFDRLKGHAVQCPACKSLPRHRHLFVHVMSLYPFLEGKKVLYFAPEPIFKKIFSTSKCDFYDADLNSKRATHQVDMTDIPFDESTFDYIFATDVLEHIPDDRKAMSELYRVLKKGGTAYLSVPLQKEFAEDLTITDPKVRKRLYGQHDHVRFYNIDTFCERLGGAGFNTDLISWGRDYQHVMGDAKLSAAYVFARKL